MTVVTRPTRKELEERRREILRHVGMTRDELKLKAATGRLVGDEWSAWAEIGEIDYLLAA